MPSDNTRPRLKKLEVTPPAKSNLGNSAPPTPFILTDIRKIIREEINEAITTILGKRLDMLENKLREFSQVTKTIVEIEHAMEFAANQVQDLRQVALPTMDNKIKGIATALVKRSLDLDVHRKKWSLTIQGLQGDAGEQSYDTRRRCIDLARHHLGVEDADHHDISACHRLRSTADAGVIIRFV